MATGKIEVEKLYYEYGPLTENEVRELEEIDYLVCYFREKM